MKKYEVNGQIKKWYTMTENVDTETGELISNNILKRDYYVVKINRKIDIKEHYGTIKYIRECKPTRQIRIDI